VELYRQGVDHCDRE